MRAFALLTCVAKAALKGLGKAAGLGAAVDIAEEAAKEWGRTADAGKRKAELEATVRLAAAEFRQQVEAVVREVAGDKPAAVQQKLSTFLLQLPDLARQRFRRPDDRDGRSVPPGFRPDDPADLVSLLPAKLSPVATETDDPLSVTIRYTRGPLAGKSTTFTGPGVMLVGRDDDCHPKLPHESCGRVSRRHCFLEIHPPDVRLRDLGSLHGTTVNGQLIGKRPEGTVPNPKYQSPVHLLGHGAEVQLADRDQMAFTVHIQAPPPPKTQSCAWCGATVTGRTGRAGLLVCESCQGNMSGLLRGLVGAAESEPELNAIHGYELIEKLGEGGMGAVYLARHPKAGPAAVKVMLPKLAADDRAVRQFQREVRNTMALSHRNVVRCLDHGFSKGVFFLVLEYCDGGSVAELIRARGGTLPVDEAVEIGLQALDGLHHAHTATVPFVKQADGTIGPGVGLVHRDIKPANLFLTGWGSGRVVKVGDYGLAKGFDEAGLSGGTRTGEVAGTWEFMCRQQVIGYKTAGPEVDVWAVAASLYQMLTGALPRDFPPDRDPWLVILEDDVVPVRKRNTAVPKPLAELLDEALSETNGLTFRSADHFRTALSDAA